MYLLLFQTHLLLIHFLSIKALHCSTISSFYRESSCSALCSANLSGKNSGEEGIPGGHHGEKHTEKLIGHCVCGLKRAQMLDFWDSTHGKIATWDKRWKFRMGTGYLNPSYGQRFWVKLSGYINHGLWRNNLFLLMGEITPINGSWIWVHGFHSQHPAVPDTFLWSYEWDHRTCADSTVRGIAADGKFSEMFASQFG